jgi:hypothetical protein
MWGKSHRYLCALVVAALVAFGCGDDSASVRSGAEPVESGFAGQGHGLVVLDATHSLVLATPAHGDAPRLYTLSGGELVEAIELQGWEGASIARFASSPVLGGFECRDVACTERQPVVSKRGASGERVWTTPLGPPSAGNDSADSVWIVGASSDRLWVIGPDSVLYELSASGEVVAELQPARGEPCVIDGRLFLATSRTAELDSLSGVSSDGGTASIGIAEWIRGELQPVTEFSPESGSSVSGSCVDQRLLLEDETGEVVGWSPAGYEPATDPRRGRDFGSAVAHGASGGQYALSRSGQLIRLSVSDGPQPTPLKFRPTTSGPPVGLAADEAFGAVAACVSVVGDESEGGGIVCQQSRT